MSNINSGYKDSALVFVLVLSCMLSGCAGKSAKDWDGIDYSKVRDRDKYENDNNYTQPSVISCTDDDLFNCN